MELRKSRKKARIKRDSPVWYLKTSASDVGPYSLNALRDKMRKGAISGRNIVRRQRSNGEWGEWRLSELIKERVPLSRSDYARHFLKKVHRRGGHEARKLFVQLEEAINTLSDRIGPLTGDVDKRVMKRVIVVLLAVVGIGFLLLLVSIFSGSERTSRVDTSPLRGSRVGVAPTQRMIGTKLGGWERVFPNCGPVVANGMDLAISGGRRAIFPNLRIEPANVFCNQCPLRAKLPDGTALVLKASPQILRDLGSAASVPIHVCGDPFARHAGATWLAVSSMRR